MAFFPAELCERILQANVAEQCGDLEQAVRELEATASTPTLGAARVRLLRQLGRSEAATRGLNDLLQAEPPALAALLAKAEAHRAEGDGTQALATYRQILALAPGHPGARGAVWLLGGSAVSAPEPQPSAPAAISFDIEDAIAAAERAYAEGDFKLALDCFEQALGTSPDSPDLEAVIACIQNPSFFDHFSLTEEESCLLAAIFLENGHKQPAIKLLHDISCAFPSSVDALRKAREIHSKRADFRKALAYSTVLISFRAAPGWDDFDHLSLLRNAGLIDNALQHDHSGLHISPEVRAHMLHQKSDLSVQNGDQSKSILLMEAAVEADPSNTHHHACLIGLHVSSKNLDQALSLYNNLNAERRQLGEYRSVLIDIAIARENTQEALAQARILCEHGPQLVDPWLRIKCIKAFYDSGLYGDALSLCDSTSCTPEQLGHVLHLKHDCLIQLGESEQALKAIHTAVIIFPDNKHHSVVYALLMARLGRPAEAKEFLCETLAQFPDDPTLLAGIVELYENTGKIEEAIALSRKLISNSNASIWSLLKHAVLLEQVGNFREALEFIDKIEPTSEFAGNIHSLRGKLYTALGNFGDAISEHQSAIICSPLRVDLRVEYALCLMEVCDYTTALGVLVEAESLSEYTINAAQLPWSQYAKARIYHELGEYDIALSLVMGITSLESVGFHSCCLRAELLSMMSDSRAEASFAALKPVSEKEILQVMLLQAQHAMRSYDYLEALRILADILNINESHLLALEISAQLHALVCDFAFYAQVRSRIIETKLASHVDSVRSAARHGMHQLLYVEFNTNHATTGKIQALWSQPPSQRVHELKDLYASDKSNASAAINLLIAARQSSHLDSWAGKSFSFAEKIGPPGLIPHNIVQFWDNPVIPAGVVSLMRSWALVNPTFQHQIFSTLSAKNFIQQHCSPLVQKAFSIALSPVLQSDVFRLAYLSVFGGVYADADDRCRHSLLPLLSHDTLLVLQQENIGSIGNNFIAVAPGHPIINMALEMACNNVLDGQGDNPWFLSGPGVLTLCFCKYYSDFIAANETPPPAGLRLFSQHQLSRLISFHLQTPVKIADGHWPAKSDPVRAIA
jgi:tetratricopeptide (TPR) repeat protein